MKLGVHLWPKSIPVVWRYAWLLQNIFQPLWKDTSFTIYNIYNPHLNFRVRENRSDTGYFTHSLLHKGTKKCSILPLCPYNYGGIYFKWRFQSVPFYLFKIGKEMFNSIWIHYTWILDIKARTSVHSKRYLVWPTSHAQNWIIPCIDRSGSIIDYELPNVESVWPPAKSTHMPHTPSPPAQVSATTSYMDSLIWLHW